MEHLKKVGLKALVLGTMLAALVVGGLFMFINRPQCPENYTQAQVDSSGCIVGANIGFGLLVMIAPFIWFGCIVLVYTLLARKGAKH